MINVWLKGKALLDPAVYLHIVFDQITALLTFCLHSKCLHTEHAGCGLIVNGYDTPWPPSILRHCMTVTCGAALVARGIHELRATNPSTL